MSSPLAAASEGTSSNDEGALIGKDLKKRLVCCVENLMTKKTVHIVLLYAIMVRRVRADGMNRQIAVDVVDNVWWLVDVADTRSDSWRHSICSRGSPGRRRTRDVR